MVLHKNNVVIVGHGPSTKGRCLGNFIDLCDVVIRMIECDWQDAEDYGSKYSIGLYATGGSDGYTKAIRRIPNFCWWAYMASDSDIYRPNTIWDDTIAPTCIAEKPVRLLRKTVWDWFKGSKKFSRGTAAAIASMALLNPTTVYLVGFDDVARGAMVKDAYHPIELQRYLVAHNKTLCRSETDHDWKNEGVAIQSAAEYYGVEVNFV